MAGNKTKLKSDIKAIMDQLKTFDGSDGKKQDDAIEKFANDLSQAISDYVVTLTIQASQAQVASAAMVAGTYPVVAGAVIESNIMEL